MYMYILLTLLCILTLANMLLSIYLYVHVVHYLLYLTLGSHTICIIIACVYFSFTGSTNIQMLDALLIMYIDIPERMNPGVSIVQHVTYNIERLH